MPIYEYECTSCGEKFELRRGIIDSDSGIKCPRCVVGNPHRVISTFAPLPAAAPAPRTAPPEA